MTAEDDILHRVETLSERGNVLLEDEGDWRGAAEVWTAALDLLPEPKSQWEAALWLYASLGDAYRVGGQLDEAKDALFTALNCPDGHMNVFVLLRLGQTLFDLGDKPRAKEYLLRAYMLDGEDPFEEDGALYLAFLREQGLLAG